MPPFRPHISTRDVFERLIDEELRSGRLTPWRRRRIVRYAARLGLSAVEAGRYVDQCRDRALASADPVERSYGLQLVEPPESPTHSIVRAAVALAIGVLIGLVLWEW